ncbi:MAG TPA: metallopeptidase family protein [Bacteroidota bacterium]|nr:metallopeptidase family protein [Bacteroidota bacterium]
MIGREEFERIAQEVFDALPAPFRGAIDNVRIVVEDRPRRAVRAGYRPGTLLLGLYEGVPLTRRGASYGAYAVVPDTITLYRENIGAVARDDEELKGVLRDTLIHEIGHYFGMSEREIRAAGY